MTNFITPPQKLVQELCDKAFLHGADDITRGVQIWLIKEAFQAGADQELEGCCKWVQDYAECGDLLRAARRSKPPSLKEQALTALDAIATGANNAREQHLSIDTIRQALEQLND